MQNRSVLLRLFSLLCLPAALSAADKAAKSPQPPANVAAPALDRSRLPIPDPAAQARAEKNIREVFQKEYTQSAPADRQALARKLVAQAMDTTDDSAARFVLLREARDMAAAAADAVAAARAIDMLTDEYQIDSTSLLVPALTTANHAAATPQAWAAVAQAALNGVDRAIIADQFDSAMRLANLAQGAADRGRDAQLTTQAQATIKEIEVIFLEFKRAQAKREELKSNPDSAEAAHHAGRFICFAKADWTTGLPLLARGDDPTLRTLARDDLAAVSDPSLRLDVANRWWDLSATQTGLFKSHVQSRAAHWYRLALPLLTGINRGVAEKRIESVDIEALKPQYIQPGLSVELFKGIDFRLLAKTRLDPRIDFDWGEAAPDDALPRDNFSLRWTGLLRPSTPGRYELVIIANTGARLWIDDRPLLDADNLSRRRNGERIAINLTPGLHTFRLDYWDTTGAAKMKLLWRLPGSERDEPIPASAFYHDATGIKRK